MKLLFDENISYRILKKIKETFPESEHVNSIKSKKLSDIEIFNHAKKNGYLIVTHDEDFVELQLVYGFPPKIIWLRTGNTSTQNIMNKLEETKHDIEALIDNPEIGLIEIY